ncbi:hypothetical protein ILUMI_19970 [Ignelater luminosus]|uniref:Uncharacterized protein n=1 Tax=Ignelater luminosus TaxID=2038154 RepID=A0A8K0CJ37_IGNLU|nr:hypothetical protein ILUMI_19970 [Ignelater luminosus]
MDDKEATEEFIRKESAVELPKQQVSEQECEIEVTTEFDAVHPRFREPKKPEAIEEFQRANDYYCEQCKLYFAPDVVALKTHFREDMVKHKQIAECFYCKGPVYGYKFNNEQKIYHNCEESDK